MQLAFPPRAQRNAFRRRDGASAIQIVCPLESIAQTHPQLQPALLGLSAALLIVIDHLRRSSATADSSYGEFAAS